MTMSIAPGGGRRMAPDPVRYLFEEGSIEPARNLVRLDGEPIGLEPRAMEVLAYLAAHSGHVVSKDELLRDVWQGRWVTEEALSVYVYELRKALGDDARRPRFLETVRKRGYRWIPPVRVESLPLRVHEVATGDGEGEPGGAVTASPAQEREQHPVRDSALRWRLSAAVAVLVSIAGASSWILAGTGPSPATRRAAVPAEDPAGSALAHEELRRGDEYFRGRSPQDLLRAESCYLRATTLDPTLADAWGGLAMTYAMMAEYPLRDRFELYHEARRAAETSFELAPDSSPAHVAVAMVRLVMDWDRAEARRQIALAIETGPNISRAWEIRGWIESADGDYDAAISSLRRSIELDPLSGYLHAVLAFVHGVADDTPAMVATLDRAVELDPGNYLVYWYGWVIRWTRGEYEEAVPWLLEAIRLSGRNDQVEGLESAYRDGGFSGLLTYYSGIIPEHANLVERARIAHYFDRRGEALDLLEEAAANRDSALTWLATFPNFRSLQGEPRFRELVLRIGGTEKGPAAERPAL